MTIGIWGLISEMQLFGFGYSMSGPLLVILAGAVMVWRALKRPQGRMAAEN